MYDFDGFIILTFLLSIFFAIMWLVIGWRVMRAHERLADSLEWIARQYYRKEQDKKEQNLNSSTKD